MIQCKKCLDIIESLHRHDFKWCSCQSVYIDGGREYQRIGWAGNYDEVVETDSSLFIKNERNYSYQVSDDRTLFIFDRYQRLYFQTELSEEEYSLYSENKEKFLAWFEDTFYDIVDNLNSLIAQW